MEKEEKNFYEIEIDKSVIEEFEKELNLIREKLMKIKLLFFERQIADTMDYVMFKQKQLKGGNKNNGIHKEKSKKKTAKNS